MVPGSSGRAQSPLVAALSALRRYLLGTRPLRLELIVTAHHAPKLLGDSASLIGKFVLSQQNADGGFRDRDGRSDLYYTVFGMQSLVALGTSLPAKLIGSFVESYGDGENLDFVHLCCLARCWALLRDMQTNPRRETDVADALARRIEAHRASDGGYHPTPASSQGTAYAAFLALGAYQDLKIKLQNPKRLAESLRLLSTPDGAWANELPAKIAATNSTAAAMAVLGNLGFRANYRQAGRWLLAQAHPLGGFRASPLAPAPDLLSTATALHAITTLGISVQPVRESCLDFIDTLWSNEGGFHGHWHDDLLDVEYTFYGVLALGCLAR